VGWAGVSLGAWAGEASRLVAGARRTSATVGPGVVVGG